MTNTEYGHLLSNFEYLKFIGIQNHTEETIDFVNNFRYTDVQGLIKMTDYEEWYREANIIKATVIVGGFPHFKGLDDFDFQENINKDQIIDFITHRFIHENRNIAFMGSSGAGKTHLAASNGILFAKKQESHTTLNVTHLSLN
ncbi:ATP-binding protein [Erysipelothrix larvae]|uniref:ATP-binding protein n=1 Tax=Erysipelothrix larvae TaxID=1514105 RepID=UPI000A515A88|nr:ATP-binding protein [Erysipelothrix larvae]